MRHITGTLLGSGRPDTLEQMLLTGAWMIALVILQALCSYYSDYQGHYLGAKIERDMRDEMFRHCEKLSFSYYDDHTVGDLMSRITNDSLALAEFFHHVPEDVVVNLIKFLGAAVILLWINPLIALVILAFLPFMTLYTLYFNKKMAAALELGRRRGQRRQRPGGGLPLRGAGGAVLRQRGGGAGEVRAAERGLLRSPPPELPGRGTLLGRAWRPSPA